MLNDDAALSVTILACGERWKQPNEDGELRFAIEDYLGAGAILSALPAALARSPEARVCQGAFGLARRSPADPGRELPPASTSTLPHRSWTATGCRCCHPADWSGEASGIVDRRVGCRT